MKLHELSPAEGAAKDVKRIGRGHGSGHGKTAGKGHKGQWARSGGGVKPGFEGGQTKLAMRIPKRGFKNIFATEYVTVNIADLEDRFEGGAQIDVEALEAAGLIKPKKSSEQLLKILGNGELTKSFTVKAAKFTAAAAEKIEKAGGKAEVV